jgi:hypothetical protein
VRAQFSTTNRAEASKNGGIPRYGSNRDEDCQYAVITDQFIDG